MKNQMFVFGEYFDISSKKFDNISNYSPFCSTTEVKERLKECDLLINLDEFIVSNLIKAECNVKYLLENQCFFKQFMITGGTPIKLAHLYSCMQYLNDNSVTLIYSDFSTDPPFHCSSFSQFIKLVWEQILRNTDKKYFEKWYDSYSDPPFYGIKTDQDCLFFRNDIDGFDDLLLTIYRKFAKESKNEKLVTIGSHFTSEELKNLYDLVQKYPLLFSDINMSFPGTIKVISLYLCNFYDEDLLKLVNMKEIMQNLIYLDISGTDITIDSMETMATILKMPNIKLVNVEKTSFINKLLKKKNENLRKRLINLCDDNPKIISKLIWCMTTTDLEHFPEKYREAIKDVHHQHDLFDDWLTYLGSVSCWRYKFPFNLE